MTFWTITRKSDGAVVKRCTSTPELEGFSETTHDFIEVEPFDPALCEWTGMAWEPSLTILKARKAEAVNALRLQAESAGCNTPFGVVDSDDRSQRLLSGAALMALIASTQGQPFAESWTMHDNNQVDLDAAGMIAMSVAVGIYISAVHARGVELKEAIDGAADVTALDAISIATGWPT